MDLTGLLRHLGLRAKILHRLPGRLRIRIPALNRVPQQRWHLARNVIQRLPVPEGITSLEPSFITGNVLLTYEPETLSEQQVIEHIDWLVKFAIEHRQRLMTIPPDDLPRVVEQLKDYLEQYDGKGMRSAREVEIPQNVWT